MKVQIQNNLTTGKPGTILTTIVGGQDAVKIQIEGVVERVPTPVELQVHSHICISGFNPPFHPEIPRFKRGQFWDQDASQSTNELENFQIPIEGKHYRDQEPFKSLDHADWWNHIEPDEIKRLLRHPETRNLPKYPQGFLHTHLADCGMLDPGTKTWFLEKLPRSATADYLRKTSVYNTRDPESWDWEDPDYLSSIIITKTNIRLLLLENILGHQYGKTPEEREDFCFEEPSGTRSRELAQLLLILRNSPGQIQGCGTPEEQAVWDFIHETLNPEFLNLYRADLPPSWYLHHKLPFVLPKTWDDIPIYNPDGKNLSTQRRALLDFIREKFELHYANSIVRIKALPEEWLTDTERMNSLKRNCTAKNIRQLKMLIENSEDARNAHLEDTRSLFHKKIKNLVAGKI